MTCGPQNEANGNDAIGAEPTGTGETLAELQFLEDRAADADQDDLDDALTDPSSVPHELPGLEESQFELAAGEPAADPALIADVVEPNDADEAWVTRPGEPQDDRCLHVTHLVEFLDDGAEVELTASSDPLALHSFDAVVSTLAPLNLEGSEDEATAELDLAEDGTVDLDRLEPDDHE